jgi:hypothetical protein
VADGGLIGGLVGRLINMQFAEAVTGITDEHT